MTRHVVVAVALWTALSSGMARAEGTSWLVGPLFGVRLGGPAGPRGIIGIEGGVGEDLALGLGRLNVGLEYRNRERLTYVQADLWRLVGVSLGVMVDSRNQPHGIFGLWEGLPLTDGALDCEKPEGAYGFMATIAAGWRYLGGHELYVTPKIGFMQNEPFMCD